MMQQKGKYIWIFIIHYKRMVKSNSMACHLWLVGMCAALPSILELHLQLVEMLLYILSSWTVINMPKLWNLKKDLGFEFGMGTSLMATDEH